MAEDERAYFMRRSEQHRAAAARADDAATRELHDRFAEAYARRADQVVDHY